MEYWILDYYEKEVRYLIRDIEKINNYLSVNVKNIVDNLNKMPN